MRAELTKEGDAWGVDGAQLLEVAFVVVGVKLLRFFQRLLQLGVLLSDFLKQTEVS